VENIFNELDKDSEAALVPVEEYKYESTEEAQPSQSELYSVLESVAEGLTNLRNAIHKLNSEVASLISTEQIVELVFNTIQEARRKAYVRPHKRQAPGRPTREPVKTKIPKAKKPTPVKKAKPKKVVKKVKKKIKKQVKKAKGTAKTKSKVTKSKPKAKKTIKSKASKKSNKSRKL
jgi:outer membrane biosynthesis protein TonB